MHDIFWWTHLLTILSFAIYIPLSKHMHLLASPLAFFFASLNNTGVIDTPKNMKNDLGNEIISLVIESNTNYDSFLLELKKIEFIKKINEDDSKLTLFTSNGTEVIPKIFQISSDLGIKIKSISLTQPTLDDVFISYTGHEIRDDDSKFNRRREHAKMKRLRQ